MNLVLLHHDLNSGSITHGDWISLYQCLKRDYEHIVEDEVVDYVDVGFVPLPHVQGNVCRIIRLEVVI